MFFLHELEQTIFLHPSFFGPRINDYIERQLINDLEGTFNGRYFIVCILSAFEMSEGRVVPGTAQAEYTVHYKAVVWRPFRGEVLDGLVETVTEAGFFVDVGPLSVFISQQMIPKEIKYDGNATPAQWTDNGDQVIEKGTQVRLKVKGTRGEAEKMFAIATIKEDYLGPLPAV
ncbi:DNA-directed RNA polymerase II 19 kDa polypeptide [Pseudovirgaria hyperparasitica]|uniref:DNA-directed RNA polymerase subunit n=1 Tax=Pseudovirgaria hyperparasitica TaxID=470096 RepID=A0A6A6W567_9PEZI|nr:DNA-directed RNA polymerase II 19 kDa polypeptide [Pseudovirgaria hyperparasitica]KAF2756707.1 DNA-directed RNA polymerase II 19 kDa polypeptide [Pseudovirgaria hyperparasitica]